MPETTYQVTIDERVVRVRVRRDGERVLVRVDDGEEQAVQLGTIRGPLRWLGLGDRRTDLMAVVDADGIRLAVDGLELRAEVLDEARARLASVAGGRAGSHIRRELKAPMPGLLVKVLCQVGDVVEAGQPLVVLQAMKMENELSLPRGGTIKSVGGEPGQSVEQGQVLVVLE
ncbi:MAG TPA: biotin/lipoyl-containing protein [Chloroflexota bacterium]|nr:biotin/lipoyl-containing protein [Chloroflexota bacterium]